MHAAEPVHNLRREAERAGAAALVEVVVRAILDGSAAVRVGDRVVHRLQGLGFHDLASSVLHAQQAKAAELRQRGMRGPGMVLG
jgi:hypothetical protein